jgi:hypothetical protein
MTTNQCIKCKHIDLKSHISHVKNGIARCKKLSEFGEFQPLRKMHECKTFEIVDKPVLLQRKIFYDEQKAKLDIFKI